MNKLFLNSALLALISGTSYAGTYSGTDSFDSTIDFVTAISISIEDLTIENAVGGDSIDQTLNITLSSDADRSISCSIPNRDLIFASNGVDPFTLNTALTLNGCNSISVDSTLPTSAENGTAYTASVVLTAAYSTTTHN